MPSHAELTRNYYHIIDPEGNLSECERAQRENEILDSMPASFPDALCYVMKIAKATKESLAYESGVSESTIGRYRTGRTSHYSQGKIVALCVGMHLPPWLSYKLVEKAGFRLADTREQRIYMWILNCMFMETMDTVEEQLRLSGGDSLLQKAG